MIITEFEAKNLLVLQGLSIPQSQLCQVSVQSPSFSHFPAYVKAQTLHGNRAELGLVHQVESTEELANTFAEWTNRADQHNNPIVNVLIEEAITYTKAWYVSFSYDTTTRGPILQYSPDAGTGIEKRAETITTKPFSVLTGPDDETLAELPGDLRPIIDQLWEVFTSNDCTLLEINPLVQAESGQWFCLDAKIELEDAAKFRHPEWANYPERPSMTRPPTDSELKAREVSRADHRGVAGESFFEFTDGTFGVLASGGGASALCMDALLTAGLKPANYTEYSGNPTRGKVAQLTDVVLGLPNLKGLYIVGSEANFTDIFETLAGVIDGFERSSYKDQPNFVILIRRGGPRWEEAFTMVKQRLANYPVKLELRGPDFPLVATAELMKQLLEDA